MREEAGGGRGGRPGGVSRGDLPARGPLSDDQQDRQQDLLVYLKQDLDLGHSTYHKIDPGQDTDLLLLHIIEADHIQSQNTRNLEDNLLYREE